eukprot:scaffold241_cov89-Cylindrotheca_fusiformis.AAC.3
MADAHYVATKILNFGFRNHWAVCEHPVLGKKNIEVFHWFFGPQPKEELQNVTSQHQFLSLGNEIPGYKKFKRLGSVVGDCPCAGYEDFLQHSAKFHASIRQRFRYQEEIEKFQRLHKFEHHTVIGLHIRAGNGEIGDFSRKNRGVEDWSTWITSLARLLMTMIHDDWKSQLLKPPILFLATDTGWIVPELKDRLSSRNNNTTMLKVVTLDQEREHNGTGVTFGNTILTSGDCLEKWKYSILDMMILSDAHVVIAGRPSSYTQSLPMSMSLSRTPSKRVLALPYCEINRNATLYQCYRDFEDWCCNGKTAFHLEGIATQYEYRRLPRTLEQENFTKRIRTRPSRTRPPNPKTTRNNALPYEWPI